MNLNRLIEDLQRIARSVHRLTPTNCGHVLYTPEHGVLLESSREEEMQDLIDDERTGAQNLQTDLTAAEEELRKAETERDELRTLLDEVKSEETPGATIRDYKERAETATEHAHTWRMMHEDMKQELTKLRKRKGITTNFVQYEREILEKLRSLPGCDKLLAKIHP